MIYQHSTSIGVVSKNFRINLKVHIKYLMYRTSNIMQYKMQTDFCHTTQINFFGTDPYDNPSNTNSNTGYTILKNNGITIISNMINLCYEKQRNNLTPYICFGIGGDFIEIFDTTKIKVAYQGKFGINYSLTSRVSLLVGRQYHKL